MPDDTSDTTDSTDLESLNGVGPVRADSLRDAGFPDVESLAGASEDDLMAAEDIDDDLAEDIMAAVDDSDVEVADADSSDDSTEDDTEDASGDTTDAPTDDSAESQSHEPTTSDMATDTEGEDANSPIEELEATDADTDADAAPAEESGHVDGTVADHSVDDGEPEPETVSTHPVEPDSEDEDAKAADADTAEDVPDYVRLKVFEEYVCAGLWVDDVDTERPVVVNSKPVQEAVEKGRAEVVDSFSEDEVTVQTE